MTAAKETARSLRHDIDAMDATTDPQTRHALLYRTLHEIVDAIETLVPEKPGAPEARERTACADRSCAEYVEPGSHLCREHLIAEAPEARGEACGKLTTHYSPFTDWTCPDHKHKDAAPLSRMQTTAGERKRGCGFVPAPAPEEGLPLVIAKALATAHNMIPWEEMSPELRAAYLDDGRIARDAVAKRGLLLREDAEIEVESELIENPNVECNGREKLVASHVLDAARAPVTK